MELLTIRLYILLVFILNRLNFKSPPYTNKPPKETLLL